MLFLIILKDLVFSPFSCPRYEIMRDTWTEDPTERPNFKTVIKFLASLMKYDGDIDEDLRRETANCATCHKYHKVEIPFDDKGHQQLPGVGNVTGREHIYSEPDEPMYSNCSQEEDIFGVPMEYEVPIPTSQTSEGSVIPMDYEIPKPKIERRIKDVNRAASVERISSNSPCHQPSPLATNSPHRSPGRHSVKSIKIPVSGSSIKHAPRRGASQEPDKISPPYSKLGYPRTSDDSSTSRVPLPNSMPTSEKPYSVLEWNSGHAFDSKSHHYHTLEYSRSYKL